MLKSKALVLAVMFMTPVLILELGEHLQNFGQYSEDKKNQDIQAKPENPLLVIIGEDLSISHCKYPKIQVEDIEAICNQISKSGRGGQVVLGTVGDPTPKGYIVCGLSSYPKAVPGETISLKAQRLNRSRAIERENKANILSFLSKSRDLLKNCNHKITDINGFFDKAKVMATSPGASKNEIWLYINSDGIQSVPPKKDGPVDCSKRPNLKNVKYYVSGWNEKFANCDTRGVFLDPQQFVKFFQEQVKLP